MVFGHCFTDTIIRCYSSFVKNDLVKLQYISEKIKSAGIDGLSFNSSKYAYVNDQGMREHGVNYVIFNYNKCKAVSSKLYRVKSIEMVIE